MKLGRPRLAPYWYTPEGQDEFAFRLRPLTEPQMVDVEEHYQNGQWTNRAQWHAGTLGIIAVRGIENPDTGEPARVPECFAWIPRTWIRMAGMRLIVENRGFDWDEVQKELDGESEAEIKPKSPEDDPEGN